MTQEQTLITVLKAQRNAALDTVAELTAIAEMQRQRIVELEQNKKEKKP